MKENLNEDEIDFGIIFRILWSEKKLVIVCLLVFEILAVVRLQIATPTYDVSMTVASPAKDSSRLDTGLLGSVGSLVGLSGVGGQTNFEKYHIIMVSNDVAAGIFADQALVKKLFSGQWDEEVGDWRPPSGIRPLINRGIRFILGMEPWHEPDSETLSAYLKNRIQFTVDKDNGFLKIVINHKRPILAAELLMKLHMEANLIVKDSVRTRTADRVLYLNQTLPDVRLDSHRDVLIEMLSTEGQKLITVEADKEFAAELVESPFVPRARATPDVKMTILLMGFLGGLFGLIIVLWKSREQLKEAWN